MNNGEKSLPEDTTALRLTVVLASVLFSASIVRAFDSRPLCTVLAALALLLFLGTLVALRTMPVCHE